MNQTDSTRPTPVVAGAARLRGAAPERALPELIFDVVSAALEDAGTSMSEVDGVVIAAHDLVDGRSLSSMITGPAAGAYLRDEIRVSDDGLVAVSLAAARIQAAEATTLVVAAWGRASEGDPLRTSRAGFDPFIEAPLGLDDSIVSALRAASYLGVHGADGRSEAAAVRRTKVGSAELTGSVPPLVLPLRADEQGSYDDVAAAVVLTADTHGIRLTGIGHGTEPTKVADRALHELPGASDAIACALRDAQMAIGDVDVVEFAAHTLFDEVLMIEAARIAPPGAGFEHYAEAPWINPSGGSALGACPPCSGLMALVEAVHQLRGTAGAHQVDGSPSVALVAAGSTVAGQTTTAVVMRKP